MIVIRKVTPTDVPTVVTFIEKKAAFDRSLGCFDGLLGTTPGRVAKALFGEPVFAYAILAVHGEASIGFAFYHYRFSSFQARPSLWLDDLYVDADDRRAGAGLMLMAALAEEAILHSCTHIAWTADAKNPSGIPFYTKIGATLSSQQDSRLSYRIDPSFLAIRAKEIRPA